MKMYSYEDFDRLEQSLINDEDFNNTLKFHSSTTFNFAGKIESYDSLLNEYSNIAPSMHSQPLEFSNEITLSAHSFETTGSIRNFNKNKRISFDLFSNIIKESFGESREFKRLYPSAGALYVIVPIIYIFDEEAVEGITQKGIYIYDVENHSIKLIKVLTEEYIERILNQIVGCQEGQISNILFGYSLNLTKSLAKYKLRGYRHGIIEVGSIIQNVRNILHKNDLYEVSWSGFNDYSLTKLSGLNSRNAPIILLQWWGYSAF